MEQNSDHRETAYFASDVFVLIFLLKKYPCFLIVFLLVNNVFGTGLDLVKEDTDILP